MSHFLQYALEILETAELCAASNEEPTPLTIVIDREGRLQMLANCERSLESVASEFGGGMVYRLSWQGNRLRVAGQYGAQKVILESPARSGLTVSLPETQPRHLLQSAFPAVIVSAGAGSYSPLA